MTTVNQANPCFMIIFASQTHPSWPRSSHTFAAAVRAEAKGGDEPPKVLEERVISWLPETLVIRPAALEPEPGRNLGLVETLDWALDRPHRSRVRITAWGPFQIEPSLFDAMGTRIAQLESGSVQYIVLDKWYRPNYATHCVHALSDLGLSQYLLRTGGLYGAAASLRVLEYFKLLDQLIDPTTVHDWVNAHFGLGAYPIRHRPVPA